MDSVSGIMHTAYVALKVTRLLVLARERPLCVSHTVSTSQSLCVLYTD